MNSRPELISVTTSEWQPAPAAVPSPLVAIGDIHGAHQQLAALRKHLDTLEAHRRVYVGDFIDPHHTRVDSSDCASVLDQVAADLSKGADALGGNHESFFLIARENVRRKAAAEQTIYNAASWYQNGAAATAQAFGVIRKRPWPNEEDLSEAIWNAMSVTQRRVFDALRIYVDYGGYRLSHAGFDNTVDLEKQKTTDWLRTPFMRFADEGPLWHRFRDDEDFGIENLVQIHGHSMRRTPFLGRGRICIDTGAKVGGPLTAIEIAGDRMRLHQAWSPVFSREAWEENRA